MASRVNVGVQKYNMPSNIYEMSKDAQKSSIPGAIGSLTDELGMAIAERVEAEKFAKLQRDRNNLAEANRLAKSGDYSKPNYDEAYNLEFGDITEEDKSYDPFKKQAPLEEDPGDITKEDPGDITEEDPMLPMLRMLIEEDPTLLEDPMYGINVDDIRYTGDELFV